MFHKPENAFIFSNLTEVPEDSHNTEKPCPSVEDKHTVKLHFIREQRTFRCSGKCALDKMDGGPIQSMVISNYCDHMPQKDRDPNLASHGSFR